MVVLSVEDAYFTINWKCPTSGLFYIAFMLNDFLNWLTLLSPIARLRLKGLWQSTCKYRTFCINYGFIWKRLYSQGELWKKLWDRQNLMGDSCLFPTFIQLGFPYSCSSKNVKYIFGKIFLTVFVLQRFLFYF